LVVSKTFKNTQVHLETTFASPPQSSLVTSKIVAAAKRAKYTDSIFQAVQAKVLNKLWSVKRERAKRPATSQAILLDEKRICVIHSNSSKV
jgi:hypothetical protein